MRTDEETFDTRIALQPETDLEQRLLSALFERLVREDDSPNHPDHVGTVNVHYTLDVPEYDGLDHGLSEEREVDVTDGGMLDPEPGTRALVVIHGDETTGHPTEEEIDEAVESLAEGSDEDNEFTEDAVGLAEEIAEDEPLDALKEFEAEQYAAEVSTTGVMDVPSEGRDKEEIIEDLRDFVDVVEQRVREEIDDNREE